jgi:glucose-6-phosphate 1-dehydrogenase
MDAQPCDALVLFGVTGDLAGKMVLPSIGELIAPGSLDVPVIGVARRDPEAPASERVKHNIERNGALDPAASATLAARLRYVEGDLSDPSTFRAIGDALGDATRPLFYLAIPPSLFAGVAAQLAQAGLTRRARIAVEKPFGHDLRSAQELERALERAFAPESILRIDHYLAKWPVRAVSGWRAANPWMEQVWHGTFVRCVQVTMAESFGVETRGSFYDRVGALLDVVQNHLLEVVAVLAMELPERDDGAAWQDARVAALSAIQPVSTGAIVRGQYEGYRDIEGVRRDSQTETFVALRFDVDTPRWRGVPFCVRAGKRLAVTTTEALARLAPTNGASHPGYIRIGLGPSCVDIGVGLGSREEPPPGAERELRLDLGCNYDRQAYVTLIDAAMRGDTSYSERADGVMAAWRAVEPALRASLPVHRYAPGSWGPSEADRVLPAGERWHAPTPK